eukprot:maker-scaffold143_size313727-snap-gene-1.24 protein:Tk09417 transcript:maker-scaffold143_size313727-snap-gene-1.24-mRNA-1 annotation:"---NA---"
MKAIVFCLMFVAAMARSYPSDASNDDETKSYESSGNGGSGNSGTTSTTVGGGLDFSLNTMEMLERAAGHGQSNIAAGSGGSGSSSQPDPRFGGNRPVYPGFPGGSGGSAGFLGGQGGSSGFSGAQGGFSGPHGGSAGYSGPQGGSAGFSGAHGGAGGFSGAQGGSAAHQTSPLPQPHPARPAFGGNAEPVISPGQALDLLEHLESAIKHYATRLESAGNCDMKEFRECTCVSPAVFTKDGRGNCNLGVTKPDKQVWCYRVVCCLKINLHSAMEILRNQSLLTNDI